MPFIIIILIRFDSRGRFVAYPPRASSLASYDHGGRAGGEGDISHRTRAREPPNLIGRIETARKSTRQKKMSGRSRTGLPP